MKIETVKKLTLSLAIDMASSLYMEGVFISSDPESRSQLI